ncbi:hypothetical protein ACDF64_00865 [Agromyces sp. MMS24-JH15]|uniref:hypothetical protein n=1 Tax=Agromyces sp. MMS24-JH15 TaxID=3243765 RepID=UPI00374A37C2
MGDTRLHPAVHAVFTTEQGVYGVILVSGLVTIAGRHEDDPFTVFVIVGFTVVVFWIAHVYAGTVARYGFQAERHLRLRDAIRKSLWESLPMLTSAAIPSVFLLLGALGVLEEDTAIWWALWIGVVVLAVLGWIAFARRGAPWYIRVLGSAITAMFGIVMILLKAFVH